MNEERNRVAHQRRFQAWRLRDKGLTYRAIGERLGISGNAARQLVFKYEKEIQDIVFRAVVPRLLHRHMGLVA